MSRVTPEQIKAIQELKSRKAKEREEKAAAEKETSEFIAKEFGTGDPAPETTAAPSPVESAAPAPNVVMVSAPAVTDEEIQNTLFREWLRTPEGLDASDPRLPSDAIRRGVFLEDALGKAFAAGYNSRTV